MKQLLIRHFHFYIFCIITFLCLDIIGHPLQYLKELKTQEFLKTTNGLYRNKWKIYHPRILNIYIYEAVNLCYIYIYYESDSECLVSGENQDNISALGPLDSSFSGFCKCFPAV